MRRFFTDHPTSVGETYFQHMRTALSFASTFFYCGFAAIVHAIFPFLFVKTGSQKVADLYRRMVSDRSREMVSAAVSNERPTTERCGLTMGQPRAKTSRSVGTRA